MRRLYRQRECAACFAVAEILPRQLPGTLCVVAGAKVELCRVIGEGQRMAMQQRRVARQRFFDQRFPLCAMTHPYLDHAEQGHCLGLRAAA